MRTHTGIDDDPPTEATRVIRESCTGTVVEAEKAARVSLPEPARAEAAATMSRGRLVAALAIVSLAALPAARAHEAPSVLRDVVSLSASADAELDNDRMRATLVVQAEAKDPAAVADEINRTMRWALDALEAYPGLKRETRDYRTWPRRDTSQARRLIGWSGSQSLVLEGGDFAVMATAMQTLQERLQVRDTVLDVSAETRREADDALIDRALEAFERRASRVAATLGASGYRILEVDVRTEESGFAPPPMMRSRMMEADAMSVAEPAIAGGSSRASAYASGRVQLVRSGAANGDTGNGDTVPGDGDTNEGTDE